MSFHIVLDVDGTLISEVLHEDEKVCPRPYLKEFLLFVFQHFDSVNIWTAASQQWWNYVYKKVIFSHLPEGKTFHRVWCERCIYVVDVDDGYRRYKCKPLQKYWKRKNWGMKKHNTLIVDDTPETYMQNHSNAIPILSYYGQDDDEELKRVINHLTIKLFYSSDMLDN